MNLHSGLEFIRRVGRRAVYGRLWTPTYPFRPGLYPRCQFVRAYWWTTELNFGDLLTPWLLVRHGIAPIHTSVRRSELVAVGSILQVLPSDWSGIVFGSGVIRSGQLSLEGARFLGVRGHLTSGSILGEQPPVIGDPGLLVGLHCTRRQPRWKLGLVAHHSHRNHPELSRLAALDRNIKVIDVQRTPGRVIREISACSTIATSSLHGLIVADSMGIPAVWMTPEPLVAGGDFKFLDYESVVTPGATRKYQLVGEESAVELMARAAMADAECIKQAQAQLLDALARLRTMLSDAPRSPLEAPMAWIRGKLAS